MSKMTIDNITREEFQAYRVVQEKEAELRQHIDKGNKFYRSAMLSTAAAVLSGGMVALGLGTDYLSETFTIFNGVLTLLNVGSAIHSGYQGSNNSRQVGSLEKEIEQLKAEPPYRSLCPE